MNFEDSQKLAIGTQSKLLIFNVCRLECCHWVSDICVSCALGKNHAMYVLCGLDVAHLLHVHVLKGHCWHPPSNHFRTRASAMAHQESEMRPPDHEPGAVGSYTITHACVIDGEQIFHMEVSGINPFDPSGKPFDASAVVHNPLGHVPFGCHGTYRILEKDLSRRRCILDINDTTGRGMNMVWRIDKKASDRDYQWQAWP